MLRAIDKNGQLVNLLDSLPSKQEFRCPACNGQVVLRIGAVVRPYFAHLRLKDCYLASDNESAEHLSLKAKLYQSLSSNQTVEVEAFIPEISQVADLLVNHKLALEVQCSSLPLPRLIRRSQSYQENGYQVRWLLGKKLWLQKRLTALQKQMLYFSWQLGFHLWELDLEGNQIRLKFLMHEDLFGNVHYREQTCSLDGDLMAFFRLPYRIQNYLTFSVAMDKSVLKKIQKSLLRREKKWMLRQEEAYLQGDNILQKKWSDFYPQLLPVTSQLGFCQISQDLSNYYKQFEHYYKNISDNTVQTLHPPYFYVKI